MIKFSIWEAGLYYFCRGKENLIDIHINLGKQIKKKKNVSKLHFIKKKITRLLLKKKKRKKKKKINDSKSNFIEKLYLVNGNSSVK